VERCSGIHESWVRGRGARGVWGGGKWGGRLERANKGGGGGRVRRGKGVVGEGSDGGVRRVGGSGQERGNGVGAGGWKGERGGRARVSAREHRLNGM